MSRTPSSQARPNPINDFIQITTVVFVINGPQRQVDQPFGCQVAATCAADTEEWPSAEVRRRVFKPTHELMSEGLPQPAI